MIISLGFVPLVDRVVDLGEMMDLLFSVDGSIYRHNIMIVYATGHSCIVYRDRDGGSKSDC